MRDAAFRRVSALRAARRTITIPQFTYVATWADVSQMLARYAIGNVNPFSLKRPILQENETFVAAVSWAEAPYVFRYKLADLGVLYFPLYNGEQIGANAYFEIWDVGESVAYTEEDWILPCSKLILPDLCNCQLGSDSVQPELQVSEALPAYHYCNPFCTPLCT